MKTKNEQKYNPVAEAIRIAGGQASLARQLGLKQPSIYSWVKSGIIPARRVLLVEKITGISRYDLNPEVFSR